jgi:hypothetical protein
MLALNRIKVAATHTLKRHVTTLGLESRMITAIIKHPQTEENARDQETINDGGGNEIHDV